MDTLIKLLRCNFSSLPVENSGAAFKNTDAGLPNPADAPSTTGIHVEVGNLTT
jgi:hypothetical protein